MASFGKASPEEGAERVGPAALRALGQALERTGRQREGAYALLAADALLTYAVEDASRHPDPEAALSSLLGEVASLVGDGGHPA
jgi:hypothetical protein